jgi:hypothetical protein
VKLSPCFLFVYIRRLVSGLLQLPKGTHLILDETAMTDGQLSAKGVQNLTSLGNKATRIAIGLNLVFTAELDQSFHHPLIDPRDRLCFGHPETDMFWSGIKPQAPLGRKRLLYQRAS